MSKTRPFKVGDVTTTAVKLPGEPKGTEVRVIELDVGEPWPVRAGKVLKPDEIGLYAVDELTPIPVEAPAEPSKPMTKAVLDLLKAKGSLTSIEAQGVLRCRALAKRISELRDLGWTIARELKTDTTGQRYARYHLQEAV